MNMILLPAETSCFIETLADIKPVLKTLNYSTVNLHAINRLTYGSGDSSLYYFLKSLVWPKKSISNFTTIKGLWHFPHVVELLGMSLQDDAIYSFKDRNDKLHFFIIINDE